MTNDQIMKLTAGTFIRQTSNGRGVDFEVLEVRRVLRCVNDRSGAYGHAAACVTMRYQGTDLVVDTSIHSDDYTRGEGYRTHANGERVSGWDIIGHNLAG